MDNVKQAIAVLGSTGSIGRQTLEVAGFLGMNVVALAAAGNRMELLIEQIKTFLPRIVAVADAEAAQALALAAENDASLKTVLSGRSFEILYGRSGLDAAVAQSGARTVVAAIPGAALFPVVVNAIRAGKTVALANKETLVMAGRLVMALSAEYGAPILPVDSEHSALFQCLQGYDKADVKRVILTASGGPFHGAKDRPMDKITPEQASAHPVWQMGRKISIDSSTLMNKGLEVIEAARLFGLEPDMIDVLVHPQSIVHSMVEFRDNAILAQMGSPDMRTPIQYALTYPERRAGLSKALDFSALKALTFEKPDFARFPCLSLAYDALRAGGTMPAVCNAANETAVELFIENAAVYTDIPKLVAKAMERHVPTDDMAVENILEADREARENVKTAAGVNLRDTPV